MHVCAIDRRTKLTALTPLFASQVQYCNTATYLALGSAVVLAAIFLQHALHSRRVTLLSEMAALMLLGAAVSAIYWAGMAAVDDVHSGPMDIASSPLVHDIIYYGLLPPLIFEAGFTMRKRKFFANFGAIMVYAVAGTLRHFRDARASRLQDSNHGRPHDVCGVRPAD